jgi:iron transport multicopper oxidase
MLVHDPDNPYKDQYDAELRLSISDWYHDQMPDLLKGFISIANPTGAEPVPDAALFNDSQNITYSVEPSKTYLVRISSLAAFAPQYLWFEDHTVKVVEVDGVYTEPYEAQMLYITPAQRVSVLLTTKNETGKNYPFVGSMDEVLATVRRDMGIKVLALLHVLSRRSSLLSHDLAVWRPVVIC